MDMRLKILKTVRANGGKVNYIDLLNTVARKDFFVVQLIKNMVDEKLLAGDLSDNSIVKITPKGCSEYFFLKDQRRRDISEVIRYGVTTLIAIIALIVSFFS